jgi:SMC interacting uncharacterized protein involved in chromosome segregation
MPVEQIGLDQILSILLARVDNLDMDSENQKSRFNIMFRVLYKKGAISDEDVRNSVREEYLLMKELGMIEEMPSDAALENAVKSILLWIKGDAEPIKKMMEEYKKRVSDAMAKQSKPRIDVAPAAVLGQLDRIGAQQGGKKLIL